MVLFAKFVLHVQAGKFIKNHEVNKSW